MYTRSDWCPALVQEVFQRKQDKLQAPYSNEIAFTSQTHWKG